MALLVHAASSLSGAPAWSQTPDGNPPASKAAAPPAERKLSKLVERAVKLYRARRYAEAAAAFERAYRVRPAAELAYNVARAYERGLMIDKAIAAYERFLGMTGTNAKLRSKARAALQALRREQALTQAPPASPPPPAPPPPVVSRAQPPPRAPRLVVAEPEGPSRALEYTLIGTGAAAAIAGGVFAVLAATGNNDLESARLEFPADPGRIMSLEDEVNRNALLADVLIGGGLATAGIGALLFVFRGPSDRESVANIVPMAGDSHVGITATGRF